MEHYPATTGDADVATSTTGSNKILVKGVITAALILLLLIPTVFIANLVEERQQCQQTAVAEVSNKWATAQTITGLYIIVPFAEAVRDKGNKKSTERKSLILFPANLQVAGKVMARTNSPLDL